MYYWLIVLLVMGFINMFFLPNIARNAVEQVNYDVFLTEMQEKNISQAEINEDVIYFFLKEEPADEGQTQIFAQQTPKVYSTVRMDDPQLVERLYAAGASFGEVKPKEVSPWISSIIMFVVFFLLWQFVMKKAMSKMGGIGGNAMSFGKANAKIYVKAQTGKTFQDVAGQDEAKEALNEIVDFLHNPQKYTEVGAKMPKGALLVGPPGTGKTLLNHRPDKNEWK
ncbi:MAG: ATP-dependent metallopeptidase FtsH/Yme1/Tma family protein [Anaerotignum sp.]